MSVFKESKALESRLSFTLIPKGGKGQVGFLLGSKSQYTEGDMVLSFP